MVSITPEGVATVCFTDRPPVSVDAGTFKRILSYKLDLESKAGKKVSDAWYAETLERLSLSSTRS